MKIIKIIVDKKPKGCISCPLCHSRECGKVKANKGNGNIQYTKKPDDKCMLEVTNK